MPKMVCQCGNVIDVSEGSVKCPKCNRVWRVERRSWGWIAR